MKALSPRQSKALSVISRAIQEQGFPPSVREISDQMGGIGLNAIHGHLSALEHKGYIKRIPGLARSIVIIPKQSKP